MNEKVKNYLLSATLAVFLFGVFVLGIGRIKEEYSVSERRALAQLPSASVTGILSGVCMEQFEAYSMDQFPFRDQFRTLKALSERYVFGKKDNHGLYTAQGHISKLEYPLNEEMLAYASGRFDYIYHLYLEQEEIRPYLAIVPDKNYFLAKQNGYPALDYQRLNEYMKAKLPYMKEIPIADLLESADYYRTDTHWRQERIPDVACRIGEELSVQVQTEYEKKRLEKPFYGVYYGQAALPAEPDEIIYLENDVLRECQVMTYEYGKPADSSVYNMKKAAGRDPYEMFLSGSEAIITIENKMCHNGRHLILFRDSFGSSLAPLLIPGYEHITLIDIRYVKSDALAAFVDFRNADVLFLYSTLLLNNSTALQ